jgi:hypothetical protein
VQGGSIRARMADVLRRDDASSCVAGRQGGAVKTEMTHEQRADKIIDDWHDRDFTTQLKALIIEHLKEAEEQIRDEYDRARIYQEAGEDM